MSESDGKACRKWWHRERAGVHEIVDAQGDVLVRESTQRDAVLSGLALAKTLGVAVTIVGDGASGRGPHTSVAAREIAVR